MNKSEIKPIEILADSPITGESQDLLRRTHFVEALYQEITNLPVEDSFCFGLYGGWGEGKTSVLNLLKSKLRQNQEITLFEFDPWYFASKELILKHFLEGLGRTLCPSVPKKLRKFFEKNFRKFSLGVTVLGTGGQITFEFEEKDLLKLKDEINAQIVKTEKKLVILIDDIDRLQHDEILLVFKLVKLIADFKNTIFVLSFDPEAVKSSLQSQNIDVSYIEKIVQKPIVLPKIEQGDIDQFLDSAFENLNLDKQRINSELDSFSFIYQRNIRRLFPTLRSVKRYINSLYSSLPPVVNEVHLFDFVVLEIIKVFAPRVYDDIHDNWWFYVPQRTPHEMYLNPLAFERSEEKREIVKKHIDQLLKDESQKEIFINLLEAIFPYFNTESSQSSSNEPARREKRISSTSFLKYFTLSIPNKELADKFIEQTISSWNKITSEELEATITNVLLQLKQQEKLAEFFIQLHTFKDCIAPKIAPSLIRCICRISSKLLRGELGTDWLGLTEFSQAERLIVNLLKEKEIQSVREEVMLYADSLEFATNVYQACAKNQALCYDPKQKWDVLPFARKVLMNKFKDNFVEPKKDFFQSGEPPYVLLRLWKLFAEEEKIDLKGCTCAQYVKDTLQRNPEYIGTMLNCFVSQPVGGKRVSPIDSRFDITDLQKYFDLDELYKSIVKANNAVHTTNEEKEAVELFQKVYEFKKDSKKS